LTRDELAEAIVAVDNIFVDARGIIEQTSGDAADYDMLLDAGVDVMSHEGISGDLHHKYAIIDHAQQSQDPMVITGSHNWSSSAENFNDENTVMVHDARVANLYFQEFTERWNELDVSIDKNEKIELELYPNPVSESLTLVPSSTELMKYNIISIDGKIVEQGAVQGWTTIDCHDLNSGVYTIILGTGLAKKFVKQ